MVQMTEEELKALIDYIIEQKIAELVAPPDKKLPLNEELILKLKKQKKKGSSDEEDKPPDEND